MKTPYRVRYYGGVLATQTRIPGPGEGQNNGSLDNRMVQGQGRIEFPSSAWYLARYWLQFGDSPINQLEGYQQ